MKNLIKKNFNLFLILYAVATIPFAAVFSLNEQLRHRFIQTLAHWYSKVNDDTVVFIGDSLTTGGRNWDSISGSTILHHINLAGNGYLAWQVSNQAIKALEYRPVYCIANAGTNDVFAISEGVETIENFERSYTSLVSKFKNSDTRLLVTLIPYQADESRGPLIDSLNAIIRRLAEKEHIDFIDLNPLIASNGELKPDMTTDGVHLTLTAYRLWKKEINAIIEKKQQ